MTNLILNSPLSDDQRRQQLYAGDLFLYSASEATRELCELAQTMATEAFAPYDPREAQHHLPVERYVEILAELKPKFIHDPRCKVLLSRILADAGCDPTETFFDVPRLRTVTSDGYLSSGLGYAFKPHRDTWYSPPMCQINWWLPVFPVNSENTIAFHPHYWNRVLPNTSADFNYQDWNNTGRKAAPKLVKSDTRVQSEATVPVQIEPSIRFGMETGDLLIFSAAHLHSTVPNTSGHTRLSIDFRVVHAGDLRSDTGAPNYDCRCTGTTIRDYLNVENHAGLPDDICNRFETTDTTRASLIDAPLIPTCLNNDSSPLTTTNLGV